jgi:hypothetical protein
MWREADLSAEITIRPFAEDDASEVQKLFITVNRLLSKKIWGKAVSKHLGDIDARLADGQKKIRRYLIGAVMAAATAAGWLAMHGTPYATADQLRARDDRVHAIEQQHYR